MSEKTLHTVSTAAQAAGCTESFVRHAERMGVIKPARNAIGHRVLTDDDVALLRAYKNRGQRSAHEQIDLAREDGRFWPGGQLRVAAAAAFDTIEGGPTSLTAPLQALKTLNYEHARTVSG